MVDICQYAYSATEAELRALKDAFSNDRMSTFERYVRQDLRKTIALYDTNLSLSTHIFDLMHGFEITLRNKMACALNTKYGTPLWFNDAQFRYLIGKKSCDRIDEAKKRSIAQSGQVRPGQVIAELTLGFWTSLYTKHLYQDLWVNCFDAIWPPTTGLDLLRSDLEGIRILRNRIAHHEPVFLNTHLKVHKIILHRTKQLSPEVKAIFEARLNNKISDLQATRNALLK